MKLALGLRLRFFYSLIYSRAEVWCSTAKEDRELRILAKRSRRKANFELEPGSIIIA